MRAGELATIRSLVRRIGIGTTCADTVVVTTLLLSKEASQGNLNLEWWHKVQDKTGLCVNVIAVATAVTAIER